MPILAFVESVDGKFHKPAFELLTYASDLASQINTPVIAVTINNASPEEVSRLSNYGADQIIVLTDNRLHNFNTLSFVASLTQVINNTQADIILLNNSFNGKSIGARLSARLKAGFISGALGLPDLSNGFVVKKAVYSGKGFGYFNIKSGIKILAPGINSYHITENKKQSQISEFTPQLNDADFPVRILETKRQKGKLSLTEAEIIVSGGRGLKGPENWHMIEELAEILGGATACSKPVADVGWRPHGEHVGQTGLTVSPDLYIAVGISGAIQHLAGVSSSKVIVVINKDPEAPFFKAADYAIVGDAFEVLPKLIESARKLKAVS